ncbi:MAG: LPD7 domain-containing protein [Methylocystis silviterrae]|jgi:hypothetical protein
MENETKRGWTIQRDGGEALPAPIAALVERWLALTDGDPIAALLIAAEELTLLAPARDLVAIAAHRGWERIKLTGSAEFRREAWLAASARRIEAKGYKPTEIDRAALEKMQGGFERSDKAPSFARDRAKAGSQHMQRSSSEQRGELARLETTTGMRALTSPSSSGWFSPPSRKTRMRANAFSTPRASAWRAIAVTARALTERK